MTTCMEYTTSMYALKTVAMLMEFSYSTAMLRVIFWLLLTNSISQFRFSLVILQYLLETFAYF